MEGRAEAQVAPAGPGHRSPESHELLMLQRLAGNTAVGSLVAQRQDDTQNLAGGQATVNITKPGGVDVIMLGTSPTNVRGAWGSGF